MHIEPIIIDKKFQRLGIMDSYISFIWTTRYYTVGDFEIKIDINSQYKDIIKKDFYIIREDDENVGIVEKIEVSINDDRQEELKVSGRFLSSILARRIIGSQTQLNGTVSNGIYALITNEVIAPVDPKRRIVNFLCAYSNFTDRLDAQYTGKNLLETIATICTNFGIGHKTTLTNGNELLFSLYKGVDRSITQSINPHVIFSDEYDNLTSSSYVEDYQKVITDVLVAGEGEGLARKTLWVTKDNVVGIDRYELYKDSRNMSTNSGEVSDTDYFLQLKEEGLESITTYSKLFDGTVYFGNVEYKKDIFVGDICTLENTRWGISANSRLVEMIESIGESGEYTTTPTFGL